jgi:hypothetical protein
MAPPIRRRSTSGKRADDLDLSGDLGTADDGHEGPLRLGERIAEKLQLPLHEVAGDRQLSVSPHDLRHARRGGMGSVRRAEGIVHVDIAEVGHLPCQAVIVPLLPGVEAGVLEQDHRPGLDPVERLSRGLPRRLLDETDRLAKQLLQAYRHRLQRVLGLRLALRAPEVGEQDRGGTGFQEGPQGRKGGPDAAVVADPALLQRHVVVDPHEHPLPVERVRGQVPQCQLALHGSR